MAISNHSKVKCVYGSLYTGTVVNFVEYRLNAVHPLTVSWLLGCYGHHNRTTVSDFMAGVRGPSVFKLGLLRSCDIYNASIQ